jgi:hypothetical protein
MEHAPADPRLISGYFQEIRRPDLPGRISAEKGLELIMHHAAN